MTSLFELTGNYLKVKQLAEEGADEQVIMDTLESIDDEIEDKVDGYTAVIRHLEGNVNMIDEEIKRLTKLKQTHNNTVKRMKETLYNAMKLIDRQKVKTDMNHVYIKKNPTKVVVEDEKVIPDDYFNVEEVRKLDKAKLKEYLESLEGKGFEGARLEQGEGVVIKK